ncbi:S1 family peptidase [Nannocystis pusilla]|uniref:S1 family peptidase n=1 Tax=Nannocystis pusilla TaxID=889268 RepID=UPI003BF08C32
MCADFAARLFYTTVLPRTDATTGTSFFVASDPKCSPANTFLVTNRHVVDGASSIEFFMHLRGSTDLQRLITLRSDWIDHPGGLDLCILSFASIIVRYGLNADMLDFASFSFNDVLDNVQLEQQCAGIESVTLIGYPYGFYDEVNYLPVARRGTTAVPLWVDWRGRAEFLIDIAGFRGNSGGPVLLFDRGNYTDKHGTFMAGRTRLHLLGIFSEVYQAGATALNLGQCIKAFAVRDMITQLA